MRLTIFLVFTTAALAQSDRPTMDLQDQSAKALAQHTDQIKVYAAAGKYLNSLPDTQPGGDRKKEAALIQVKIGECVEGFTYSNGQSALYAQAAGEAGRLAQELEAKTNSNASGTTGTDFTRQIEQVDRRIAELSAKSNLTESERSELEGLKGLRRELSGALDLLQQAQAMARDRTRYASAAEEMRLKEAFFSSEARAADIFATIYNIRCLANRTVLSTIAQEDLLDQQLGSWGAGAVPAPPPGAGERLPRSPYGPSAPGPAEIERLKNELSKANGELNQANDKLKDLEGILTNFDKVQQQLQYLKELSAPSGSR